MARVLETAVREAEEDRELAKKLGRPAGKQLGSAWLGLPTSAGGQRCLCHGCVGDNETGRVQTQVIEGKKMEGDLTKKNVGGQFLVGVEEDLCRSGRLDLVAAFC